MHSVQTLHDDILSDIRRVDAARARHGEFTGRRFREDWLMQHVFEAGGHALDETEIWGLIAGGGREEHRHQYGCLLPDVFRNIGWFVSPESLWVFGAGHVGRWDVGYSGEREGVADAVDEVGGEGEGDEEVVFWGGGVGVAHGSQVSGIDVRWLGIFC